MKVKPSELATILGMSRPRVSQLTADGVFEVGTDGKHDLGKSVRGYIAHLEVGALNPEIAAHRAKLIEQQTRRLKIQNDRQEKRLIPAEVVQEVIGAAITINNQVLEAIPGRCAAEFASQTNPAVIHARLKEEIRAARTLMAEKFEEVASVADADAQHA